MFIFHGAEHLNFGCEFIDEVCTPLEDRDVVVPGVGEHDHRVGDADPRNKIIVLLHVLNVNERTIFTQENAGVSHDTIFLLKNESYLSLHRAIKCALKSFFFALNFY